MEKKDPINILYTTDNVYFFHTLVSMYSLIEHNPDVKIHLLMMNVSDEHKRLLNTFANKIPRTFDIKQINVDAKIIFDVLESYPQEWRGGQAGNLRLVASELIDSKKVIYLDGDTIVNGDLTSLYKKELGNFKVAAVNELRIPPHFKKISPECSNYFNSGVMLMNLEGWSSNFSSFKDIIKNI